MLINDFEYEVKTWRDVFEKTCDYLLEYSPELMDNIDQVYPYYFSRTQNDISSRRQLRNGMYFNVGLSSKGIISICYRLLEKAGIEKEDWIIQSEQ